MMRPLQNVAETGIQLEILSNSYVLYQYEIVSGMID